MGVDYLKGIPSTPQPWLSWSLFGSPYTLLVWIPGPTYLGCLDFITTLSVGLFGTCWKPL